MQVALGTAVALLSGILAQLWKKRLGAGWAAAGYVVHAVLFFAIAQTSDVSMDTYAITLGNYYVEIGAGVASIILGSVLGALVVMLVAISSLPLRGASSS
ncbi:hypothetical protein [Azospirillum aestuarii]|uniref:hypothetical protein n=1 Tax=Azospirillum aestuarii TaxID=2802052 RepID=UPI004055267C